MRESSARETLPVGKQAVALVLASVCCVSVVMLSGCKKGAPAGFQQQTPEVGVMTVAPQHIVQVTELSGRLSALKVSDVRPQVSGIVIKRLFTEGADVKAGQVLYQIDPASYQASYDQARGTLEKAKASLVTAKAKADRYAGLVKINAVSQQDYDDALATLREDQADVVADQAAMESARVDLDRTSIKAPISGRIGASSVTEGALVTSDQTDALATIQSYGQMYLDVTRSSAQWLKLRREFAAGRLTKSGDTSASVQLTLEDGTAYPHAGTLQFSGITVDATTGTVKLRCIFPNPDGELLPGMYVRASLDEGENDNAILIPQTVASRTPDGKAQVYVVDAAGKAQQVTVTADEAYRDKWIVTQGLKPGDYLIVSGLQKVRAGAPVTAVPEVAAARRAGSSAVSAQR